MNWLEKNAGSKDKNRGFQKKKSSARTCLAARCPFLERAFGNLMTREGVPAEVFHRGGGGVFRKRPSFEVRDSATVEKKVPCV